MDTLSHALWGRGLFGYRGRPWLALLFGAMPDLLSFGPLIFIRIVTGKADYGPPPLDTIPAGLFIRYDIAHSFVVAFIVIGIIYKVNRSIAFALMAWPFHILLDFPFHTLDYFPAKIFWPLSDFVVDGISWGQPIVWFPNIAGIIVLYIFRYRRQKHYAS